VIRGRDVVDLKIPIPESVNDELKTWLRIAAKEVIEEVVAQETRMKDWMSVKEIQIYMNVSHNTVASWIRNGLPVSVVGQKRFISKKNLDSFLAKHQN
jgi:excisionase family DNA binding protein